MQKFQIGFLQIGEQSGIIDSGLPSKGGMTLEFTINKVNVMLVGSHSHQSRSEVVYPFKLASLINKFSEHIVEKNVILLLFGCEEGIYFFSVHRNSTIP